MNPPMYNPAYNNAPAFPLVPHQNQAVVQQTSVIVHRAPPQDHIIWSTCSLIYCNPLCLGLVAFMYSIKARDRKISGDVEGARHYGGTARVFNIVSLILIIAGVLPLTVWALVMLKSSLMYYSRYGW